MGDSPIAATQPFPPKAVGRLSVQELASWLLQQCQDAASAASADNPIDPPEHAVIELVRSATAGVQLKLRSIAAIERAASYVLSLPASFHGASFSAPQSRPRLLQWLRPRPGPTLDSLRLSRNEGERFLHVASQALCVAADQPDIPAGASRGALHRVLSRMKEASVGASLTVSSASLLRALNNAKYDDRSGFWARVYDAAPDAVARKELLVPVFEGMSRASVEDAVAWLLNASGAAHGHRTAALAAMVPFLLRSRRTPTHILAVAVEQATVAWPDEEASQLWDELRSFRVYRPTRDLENRESDRLVKAWRRIESEGTFASMSAKELRARLDQAGIPLGDTSAADALGEAVARMHLGWPMLDASARSFEGWTQRIWLMGQFPSAGSFEMLLRALEYVTGQLAPHQPPTTAQLAVLRGVVRALANNAVLLEHAWSASEHDASFASRRRLGHCLRLAATCPGAAEHVLETLVYRPEEARVYYELAAPVIADYGRVLRTLASIDSDWLALHTFTLTGLLPALGQPAGRDRLRRFVDAVNHHLTRGLGARPTPEQIAAWRAAAVRVEEVSMSSLAHKWSTLASPPPAR